MNISKMILRIQQIASTSNDLYELMILSKAVEKLKAGTVSVVSTTASLPAAATSTVGEIYLVESDDDLYVNTGSQWVSLNNEIANNALGWGIKNSGRLGDGTITPASIASPVSVIGGITDWSQISAGGSHSLGLTSAGVAYAWGSNTNGRLGDDTLTSRRSPVVVAGGLTWSQLSAGGSHSLGLTSAGVAYAWGANFNGRLGDDTLTSRLSPVTVVGGITNWSQVSAGPSHSLGVTSSGIAYAWGWNVQGRLGDGTTTSRLSPVSVIGGITNWSQVSANAHSVGVTTSGVAYAWGANNTGQLGDGSTISKSSPVTVIGGITNWSQLSAGGGHSLGLTSAGVAYAWGSGNNGRLGTGTTTFRSSPVTVIGGITNWSQISAGTNHSLGLTSSGVIYAWGQGFNAVLGDGTTVDKSSPVTLVGGITSWTQVAAGENHSQAISSAIKSV